MAAASELKRPADDDDDERAAFSSVPADVRAIGIGRRLTCRQLAPLARTGKLGRETAQRYTAPCSPAERARVLAGRGAVLFTAGIIVASARRASLLAQAALLHARLPSNRITSDYEWADLSATFRVGAFTFAPLTELSEPRIARGDLAGWKAALDGGISAGGIAVMRRIVRELEDSGGVESLGFSVRMGVLFAAVALRQRTPEGHRNVAPPPGPSVIAAIDAATPTGVLTNAVTEWFASLAQMLVNVVPDPTVGGYRDQLTLSVRYLLRRTSGAMALGKRAAAFASLRERELIKLAVAGAAQNATRSSLTELSCLRLTSLLAAYGDDSPGSAVPFVGLVLRSLYVGVYPAAYFSWRRTAAHGGINSSPAHWMDELEHGTWRQALHDDASLAVDQRQPNDSRWVADAFVWFLTDANDAGNVPAGAALEMSEVIARADRRLFGAHDSAAAAPQ